MRRYLPPLARTHPTFAIILFATAAVHHLYMAWLLALHLDRFPHTAGGSFYESFHYLNHWWWISGHLIVVLLTTIGVYLPKWRLVQVGLGVGLFISVMWVWLVEIGPAAAGGLAVWEVVIVAHFVQMLEPPRNPLTER